MFFFVGAGQMVKIKIYGSKKEWWTIIDACSLGNESLINFSVPSL